MLKRLLEQEVLKALAVNPVVALLGPRQSGKTTLALQIADMAHGKEVTYLDLEKDSHLARLAEPEDYLQQFAGKLLIIDEVQRKPDLFRLMRSLIDERRRAGEQAGHFLVLGSASRDLIQHSTESLAGRIRYLELGPFSISEISHNREAGQLPVSSPTASAPSISGISQARDADIDRLWLRGGFPGSYLAGDDNESWNWRTDFIATYIERDIPVMGPRVPAVRMKRFWNMLAHWHGQQVNLSSLAKSLEVDQKTVRSYLEVMVDFYMVRRLPPWSGNSRKRLVKSPKVYIRDTGLLHRLLNIPDQETLLGHPLSGASWEGLVIETIIASLPDRWRHSYYRSASQTEIDLVLEGPGQQTLAVEVKRSSAPKLSKGFHLASEDIEATGKFVVYPGDDSFSLGKDTEAIGLHTLLARLASP